MQMQDSYGELIQVIVPTEILVEYFELTSYKRKKYSSLLKGCSISQEYRQRKYKLAPRVL
jgi:hypothetical protein